MADRIKIGVEFERPGDGNIPAYRDTLWLTEDDLGEITPQVLARIQAGTHDEVNAMQEQRHANFVDAITNPPAPEPPAPVDALQAARDAVEAAEAALNAAKELLVANEE